MKTVEMYTKTYCGYCRSAKQLLKSKGVSFVEINLQENPEKTGEMQARSNGGRTVPQIFIGDVHVGGFDDMYALDRAGKLDPLLAD